MSILLIMLFSQFCLSGKAAETFSNPLIYADVPDVDVIRVGSDYYMVSTTAHMSPGAPIMHSKNMVDWEIISYVFDTLDESPKNNLEGGNIYSRGQWVASLRYNDGKFYVFFGTGNKSYLYSTGDPAGKWHMECTIDEYLHDASLLFDDNGKTYIAYGGSHIRIREFKGDLSGIAPTDSTLKSSRDNRQDCSKDGMHEHGRLRRATRWLSMNALTASSKNM